MVAAQSMLRDALGLASPCILLLGAAPATVAASTAPIVHETGQLQNCFVSTDLCSFPITITVWATFDDLLFFDESGNLVRLLETDRLVTIKYAANGRTLTAKGTGGFDVAFKPDGSTTISTFGINLLVTLPGQGTVIVDAGHAVVLFDPHPPTCCSRPAHRAMTYPRSARL